MTVRGRELLIVVLAAAAIIGAGLHGDGRWLHWLAKPLTTLLIASIAWHPGSAGRRPATSADPSGPRYRRAVLAGMVLSCLGDIALMLPVDAFVPGLVAFLLAHVCYIIAFRAGFRAGRGLWMAVVLLGAFAFTNVTALWPHLPADMRVPVLAYVVVLALMAMLALARVWAKPSLPGVSRRSAGWAAGGALLFVASDSLLAWDRFAGGLPMASLLVLGTYYAAQYGIARSVAGRDRSASV
ncbi:lysoplasmalogenase [Stenotrophomonas sp.]|uniref:lysoplasmalogenase n=1 Tax=Stenotrophomonas sp. TaxID=69392 RepID=UPI00289789AB|nr:lysoplasmalogenase [Stenotrophomonas sp.]